MLKKILLLSLFSILIAYSFLLSGCIFANEPDPVITGTAPSPTKPPMPVPPPGHPRGPGKQIEGPGEWIPPANIERKWTAIIIHHSATPAGNATIFDKWHREGRHWDGVGYDFVIGNGTDSPDGSVETTFRWTQQKTGAHCGGTPDNWANEKGIGICLVGDFNKSSPTPRQMESLAKLVNYLSSRYEIPKSRIYGHGTTPGAKGTDCPGRKFSMSKLKGMVAR